MIERILGPFERSKTMINVESIVYGIRGKKRKSIKLKDGKNTVKDLLEVLSGDALIPTRNSAEIAPEDLMIMVNKIEIHYLNGLQTALTDGSSVVILPIMVGG
jgi:molybdopterin converting factor small subunit